MERLQIQMQHLKNVLYKKSSYMLTLNDVININKSLKSIVVFETGVIKVTVFQVPP